MNFLYHISISITFLSTIASAIYLGFLFKTSKLTILRHLFFVMFYLNMIWYIVLLLQFSMPIIHLSNNQIIGSGLEILLSSLLFIARFLFLVSFFRMLEEILNLRFLKLVLPSIKIASVVIIIIWFLGWLEVPFYGSRGIVTNLMIYTDILIFVLIIIGCVFLFHKAKLIKDIESKRIIKTLSCVFIIPIIFACFKWLIGNTLNANEALERILLHSIIFLMNGLIIWWVATCGKKLKSNFIFKNETVNSELILKYSITNRELDIIFLICEGKTNKEIAEKLFISIDTVKDHNNNIFQKTGVKNRTELAKLYNDIMNRKNLKTTI